MGNIPIRILASIFIFFSSVTGSNANISNGKIDLRSHNFKDAPVVLSGKWEFYWKEFLNTEGPTSNNLAFVEVPQPWSKNTTFTKYGHATYRLQLKVNPDSYPLSILFPNINSAYRVLINGKLYSEAGVVSAQPELASPKLRNLLVHLPDTTSVDIVIHVSNYSYFRAGIVRPPVLGNSDDIVSKLSRTKGFVNFFLGSLFAMFLYQFVLFLHYPKGRPYLWLAILCLIVSIRGMIEHGGSLLLADMFPAVPVDFWKRIEFSGVYAIPSVMALYCFDLFKETANRVATATIVCCSLLLSIGAIFASQHLYQETLDVAHLLIFLTVIMIVYTAYKAKQTGNEDASIILKGLLCSMPFVVLEILQNTSISILRYRFDFELFYPAETGLLIFLAFQVYLLAKHYSVSYKNLEQANLLLENRVAERSKQLTASNRVKDKLLSIMAHDVKSPLNSLTGVLSLFGRHSLTAQELKVLAGNLEEELDRTILLIENILYWAKSQLSERPELIEELFSLDEIISSNVGLYKRELAKKNIHVQKTTTPLIVSWNKPVLHMVLRNLIVNAAKFSKQGGQIDIWSRLHAEGISIHIKDHGVGMRTELVNTIMSATPTSSVIGTSGERGTGLGLSLCQEYLTKAGGKLKCTSAIGKGTEMEILLPSNSLVS